MAVQTTIQHGVALIVGFIMAIIIEQVVEGQFTDGTVMAVVADNIVALYIVLVLALFATRMSGSVSRGGGAGGSPL